MVKEELWKNKEWLIDQYFKQKKSIKEIKNEFGFKGVELGYWFKKFNLTQRSFSEVKNLLHPGKYKNKNWLENEYVKKGRSFVDIANECKVNISTPRLWAVKFNLKIRKAAETRNLNNKSLLKDRNYLFDLHINQKKTIREITLITGEKYSSVKRYLKEHGIRIISYDKINNFKKTMKRLYPSGRFGENSPGFKFKISKDYLIEEYVNKKNGSYVIAEKVGCSHATILSNLRRYDIKVRDSKGENNGMWGKKQSEKTKQILREKNLGKNNAFYGKTHTEKLKDKNRKTMIKRLSSGGLNKTDTKIERLIENQLLFNNILYVKQYPYEMGVADFWLPEDNIIIECDGDFYHGYLWKTLGKAPNSKKWEQKIEDRIEKDKLQTEWFESNDYLVYRFWEHEIEKNPLNCIKQAMGELE